MKENVEKSGVARCNGCIHCRSTTGDNPRLYCAAGKKYGEVKCPVFNQAFVSGFSIPTRSEK